MALELKKHDADQETLDLPRHLAIIMDGNGRWAARRHLPRRLGHRQGVDTVRDIVRAVGDLGIEYLTLYGFSSENWKRPKQEVEDLMGLLKFFVRRDLAELHRNGVKVRIIGGRSDLPPDILSIIEEAESLTAANDRLKLTIAFNYGGQDEIARAARKLAEEAAAGTLDPQTIDARLFASRLDTAGLPDPDLIVRTSGEQRLSNFLIWQSAYSEFVFTETLWPDFARKDLIAALRIFASRERRYGARLGESGNGAFERGKREGG